jgi:lipoprotein-anchoring transpeptidase ErfK/SrfK
LLTTWRKEGDVALGLYQETLINIGSETRLLRLFLTKSATKLVEFEAFMGRTRAALSGFACAFVALTTPAAAFTAIDPLTRLPLYETQEQFRAQAAPPQREIVAFSGRYAPGTIVVSTSERRLYYVLGNGQAVQYGVGVGRPGFTWSGTNTISMKREWPDWRPPAAMLKRRPDLPRHMEGGPDNPLGARALYIGSSIYRIHGSNEPETIGEAVSSGCIRMTNEDVIDLYNRAKVGARVVVLR